MNRKQVQLLLENLPLLQAYANGQGIEGKRIRGVAWYDFSEPSFDFTEFDYRIKPHPLEGWVNVYENGRMGTVHATKAQASHIGGEERLRTVFMREVED